MEHWTTEAWAWIEIAVGWTIRLVALLYIPRKRSPAVARSWLLLMFFFPWLGVLLYAVFGRHSLPAWRTKLLEEFPEKMALVETRLASHNEEFVPVIPADLRPIDALAGNLGHLATTGGNGVHVMTDYCGMIRRLVEDIDEARRSIHMAFYIFAVDATTDPLLEALRRAAARGVRCRVLIDSIGSADWMEALGERLRHPGIEWREMLPVRFFSGRSARVDMRNHRKIVVIDGRIGYTGSQNMMDWVVEGDFRREDLMVRVEGPVVLQLQYVFARDWYVESEEAILDDASFPVPTHAGNVAVQALPSGPGSPVESNHHLFVSLIHHARRRVAITTPYFIPDETLLQAIETAVLRDVEVTIILPARSDQTFINLAQKSYYGILLSAGVRLMLYRRGFLHSKLMLVDDEVSVVGTSNFDIRSFSLNAELSLVFYGRAVNTWLGEVVLEYEAECQELTIDTWQGRRWGEQTTQNLARLFSPLL